MSFSQEIEAFLSRHPVGATELGRLAVNDGCFVGSIRRGRDPRLSTVDRCRAWMQAYEQERAAAAGALVDQAAGVGAI